MDYSFIEPIAVKFKMKQTARLDKKDLLFLAHVRKNIHESLRGLPYEIGMPAQVGLKMIFELLAKKVDARIK